MGSGIKKAIPSCSHEGVTVDNSVNTPLRDDVRLLGDLLGQCLRQQAGEDLYQTIETIRQASVTTRGE